MAVKVKRGAVKVGREYIESGKTVSGLSKEEETNLVFQGLAEYVPEQTEATEAQGSVKEDSGESDTAAPAETAGKGKAK